MKNDFHYFFTPFLSMVLLGLLVGVNFLVLKFYGKSISLISRYLQPRVGLHIAAYTLVQALPVSFFFFGQLRDTSFSQNNHENYSVFNIAMAYLAFFLTAAIPLLLLLSIFYLYNYNSKIKSYRHGNEFNNNMVRHF